MTRRLPLALSSIALVVALTGVAPLAGARDLVAKVVPYAKSAGTAKNALAVNGIKASRKPKPGYLVPLGPDGLFPSSLGQVGPPGAKGDTGERGERGDKGDKGDPGLAGVQIVTASSANDNLGGLKEATASCPSGKKVIGGGTESISSPGIVSYGYPSGDDKWHGVLFSSPGAYVSVKVYAICASTS
ncbi:MAG: hypothetical protein U0R50_05090 [Gaiellales bacterium]